MPIAIVQNFDLFFMHPIICALKECYAMLGCRPGSEFWEGLVAERNDSNYPRQRRSAELEFPFWTNIAGLFDHV
jgi:hypothetical protein